MALFEGTVKLRILDFFFSSPTLESHVNEIARKAKVSRSSASTECRMLAREGLLKPKKVGNSLIYSLDNSGILVKRVKSTWFLEKLLKYEKTWKNEEILSFALYGSFASGEFDEKSDIDLLAITNIPEEKVLETLSLLKKSLKNEISITVLPVSKWQELGRKKDRFYIEVLSKHILLFGGELLVG